jgi:hypothetical protein
MRSSSENISLPVVNAKNPGGNKREKHVFGTRLTSDCVLQAAAGLTQRMKF